jgi:hypothetical protein
MRRYAPAIEQDLHHVDREPELNFCVHEFVRHRVRVPLDLDVVVVVHASLAPLGVLEAYVWQRS